MRFSGLAACIALSIALDRNRVHLGYATQRQSRWGHKVQANQKRMSGVLLTDKVTSFTIFVLMSRTRVLALLPMSRTSLVIAFIFCSRSISRKRLG